MQKKVTCAFVFCKCISISTRRENGIIVLQPKVLTLKQKHTNIYIYIYQNCSLPGSRSHSNKLASGMYVRLVSFRISWTRHKGVKQIEVMVWCSLSSPLIILICILIVSYKLLNESWVYPLQ